MAGQKLKSARAIAVEVLNHYDPKRDYAGSILDDLQDKTDQKQRATDLVFGTLRNRRAIDKVIATFSGRPIKRIQEKLLNIIRIGTYELIYCPSTEQYAIVNQAVAICRGGSRTALAKQSGFVNAVLRQITRHIKNRQIPLTESEPGRTLPQTPVTGCQFDTAFLPNQQESPAKYLSTVFSLPEWLIVGWLNEFGEESTWRICLASNRRPSIYLRLNSLKTTVEVLVEKLRNAGVDLEIVDLDARYSMQDTRRESRIQDQASRMIQIRNPRNVTQLPGFTEGHFTIQDITASKPVRMLMYCRFPISECRFSNRKSKIENCKFLDLCAAPGTKTTQLAEVTGDSARIIATDIDNRRLEMVRENIARLGIKSVDIVLYEELLGITDYRLPNADFQIENSFDCVLLDVPCSNTGVLAKRVEVRYRIEPKVIRELAHLQSKLLRIAAEMVKPGGKICYSTCSIERPENNELIETFLVENQNFALESQQLMLPMAEGFDHDGGYVAILAKRETQD